MEMKSLSARSLSSVTSPTCNSLAAASLMYGVVGNYFHIEGFGAPRDLAANSSQSNQPQSFAAQFGSAG